MGETEGRSSSLRRGSVVYIPFMDDHAKVVAAAMRHHGIEAVALPPPDAESLALGRQYTSGKECLPCIATTGDMVKAVRSPDFDPSRSAFFMPTAMGPCRFGQYSVFQRLVLDDLGLGDVAIVELDQASTDGYRGDLAKLGARFRHLAWRGLILVDLLQKACRQSRPYERTAGDCDSLYERSLARVVGAVERGGGLLALAREIAAAFRAVAVDRARPKPRIGMIGEIYVRCNPHTNHQILRKLEALGAEVDRPPFQEWVDYIAYERKTDGLADGNCLGYVTEWLTGLVQAREVRRLTRPFRGVLRDFVYESRTTAVVELARPYLDPAIRGEPVLSMGRAVEYAQHGYDGLVHVIPFNCMPGTLVDALLERYRRVYPAVPVLKVTCDGLSHVGEDTRIEAFMHQAHQHLARHPPRRKGWTKRAASVTMATL